MKRLTAKQREAVRQKYDGRCAYCGEPLGQRWTVDHFEAVRRTYKYDRGKGFVATGHAVNPENDVLENLMPSCPPCNIDKHSSPLELWRAKLQDACNVLRRNSTTYRHALRYGLVSETGTTVRFYFEMVEAQHGLSRNAADVAPAVN